jgi:phenylpropionate dioxygenase-like ring-hydroxylating dioxygenase large terminal subunit
MLAGAPWLLAHRSMLMPNRPKKISLLGQDYVMWQDPSGGIHCLPNACPHMGAMLSEGWCAGDAIVCPFHALEFDAAGCTVLPGTNRKTLSLLQPLELVIRGDLIWSYGGYEPKIPIPSILDEFAQSWEFVGFTGEMSVPTDLLTMLLNMHDYNHQNGTHRQLFEIEKVNFHRFIDQGLHSHAYYEMPRKKPSWKEILKNPALLALPQTLPAHLENFFPSLVILHGEAPIGRAKQCHIFVPESETSTRTYVLMFGQFTSPIAPLLRRNFLDLANTVVQQDADILSKCYANVPQQVKLNNEVGMDWVRRNFNSFPDVVEPNLSRA